jgi:hypothetical protein
MFGMRICRQAVTDCPPPFGVSYRANNSFKILKILNDLAPDYHAIWFHKK